MCMFEIGLNCCLTWQAAKHNLLGQKNGERDKCNEKIYMHTHV